MKTIKLFLILPLLFLSCKSTEKNFYHGVVIDEEGKPIENVVVKEDFKYPQSTVTEDNGFFQLFKSPFVGGKVIFLKKGFINDTIRTQTSLYHGYRMDLFINKTPDTLVLKKIK